MQKNIALALFVSLIAFATPAHASWQTDLQAAIASGNTAQISTIAASNPDAQGQIAMTLLQAAAGMVGTNPTKAAQLYQAAAPYAAEIPAAQASTAAGYVNTMVNTAKTDAFQTAHPTQASIIFSTSLTIASLPNIVGASPNLYAAVLQEANEFLDKKPTTNAELNGLEEAVLLAQQQLGGNSLTGPQDPTDQENDGTPAAAPSSEGQPSSAE